MNGRRLSSDAARAQLSLVRSLRLVREVDRHLKSFEFEPGLVEALAGGWITMDEFRDAANVPDSTGALSVLRDGLGLYPALPDAELEIATERVTENGWTRLTMIHPPTGFSVRSAAAERSVALEIAVLFIARIVWAEVIERAEKRLESAPRSSGWLDRLVVGDADLEQVIAWLEMRRSAGESSEAIADDLCVDAAVLPEKATDLTALVETYRAQLLNELAAEAARTRCPTCGYEFSETAVSGISECPGTYLVFEQTTRWQGFEPLECPVPVAGHSYRCKEPIRST